MQYILKTELIIYKQNTPPYSQGQIPAAVRGGGKSQF